MGIRCLVVSFERAHRAQARSRHTVKLYRDCLTRLVRFSAPSS